MGVPSLFAWWAKHYRNRILSTDYMNFYVNGSNKTKKLYLDFNGAIHPAVRTDPDLSRSDMNEAVILYLINILAYVKPDAVYIAIDGVAPAAKMAQQRDRRYKSAKESKSVRDITIKQGGDINDVSVDFNMISPGTVFMYELQMYLNNKIKTLSKPGQIWEKYTFTLNGAGIPGEGEHKIMDDIRKNRKNGINDFCLIYGLDADLLFLTNINCPDAVLVRENVQFRGRDNTEYFDDVKYPYLYLSVQELHDIVIDTLTPYTCVRKLTNLGFKNDIIRPSDVHDLCANVKWYQDTPENHHRLILDYAYICFFLGNDFIPHMPSLRIRNGSLNDIIVIYKKVCWALGSFFVNKDGKSINRLFMKEFLAELEYIEEELLEQLNITRLRSISSFNRRLEQMPPLKQELERFKYIEDRYTDTICGGTPGWNNRYYNYYHDIEYKGEKSFRKLVLPICQNFIDMTIWVLQYYQGLHSNWSKLYLYDAAPTLHNMYKYFDDLITDVIIDDDQPVSPYVQLMSILPPESSELLPGPLSVYMTDPYYNLHYMYPVSVEFVLQGNRFLYECKTKMPSIDREELHQVVDYVTSKDMLTKEELERNKIHNILLF